MFSLDARNYQIIFLATFLVLGILTRDWSVRLDLIACIFVGCLLTQALFSLCQEGQIRGLKSSCITALGLSLLLRANTPTTMLLAGALAISSKFIVRVEGKHFFNPANFGIIMALIFTPDAWVSPGQWGADWWYLLFFLGTGAMVLKKVGRWDTSVSFLVTYTILAAIRNLCLGWSWDVLHHQLMSGSFLLFALFMITDPRSIPNAFIGRLVWAIALAFLTFILQYFLFVNGAFFWALFALSPLTIFLDWGWQAPRFVWQSFPSEVTYAPR
jgi:Na+-transporting NADH:ubiquinone oxidoreductase subunit NqrB